MRQSFSTPVTESREETATSSLTMDRGAGTVGSGEETRSGATSVPYQPPQPAKVKERLDQGPRSSAGGPGRAVGPLAELSGGLASGTPCVSEHPLVDVAVSPGSAVNTPAPSPRVIAASPEAPPEAPPRDDTMHTAVSGADSCPTLDGPVAEMKPSAGVDGDVPETDQALPNEMDSVSSSEEDSFPGFIEDPLEKEMQAPSPYRGTGHSRSNHEASPGWVPPEPREEVFPKPTPKVALAPQISAIIKPDRSAF